MLSFGPDIFSEELNSTSLASIEKQRNPSSSSPAPGFFPFTFFWSYPVTESLIFPGEVEESRVPRMEFYYPLICSGGTPERKSQFVTGSPGRGQMQP